jgi:hypothetical protein
MSLRSIPLIAVALVLYNVIVLLGGSAPADVILNTRIFQIPMMNKAIWVFTWGDFIILTTMIVLFVELLKSTYTSSASLLDHGLSMLVFIAALVEFILVQKAASSVFFFILIAALIDVVAGYTIGIRVAKRDLQIGGE